jgi:muramidase (phage lysozyme)
MNKNLKAFLDGIAKCEGTWGRGDDGYDVLFGGKLFESYTDHPRIKTYETHDNFIRNGKMDYTTAAGRYQILARIFDHYKKQLRLKDFGKAAQDAIAIQLIKECKALGDIEAGRIEVAVKKCKSRWASLPGAVYGQPTRRLEFFVSAYKQAGGSVA